jgi:hypothetical protein
MAALLQINFNFSVTPDEYKATASSLADQFASVQGLIWKVWIINEAANEAGGIYLFDTDASLRKFLDSSLVAGVVGHPALSDFSVKPFSVMEEQTAVTRGPMSALA